MSHYKLKEILEVPDKNQQKQKFKMISLDCKDVEYGYMFGDNPMETDTSPTANSFLCRDLCSTTSGYKSYLKYNSNTTFFTGCAFWSWNSMDESCSLYETKNVQETFIEGVYSGWSWCRGRSTK